jgi:hypothetical protein
MEKELIMEMKKMVESMEKIDGILDNIKDMDNEKSEDIFNVFNEYYPFEESFEERELVGNVRYWVNKFEKNMEKVELKDKIRKMENELNELKKSL